MATPKRAAKKTSAKKRPNRRRPTFAQHFLNELRAATSAAGTEMVTNLSLRNRLNWDEYKYAWVKGQLLNEGRIRLGGGQGGTLGLRRREATVNALRIFIAYSHADQEIKKQLVEQLKPLERLNLISHWSDRQIPPGADWDQQINENLRRADIFLPLISAHFLNSSYCWDTEIDLAMTREANGECIVIPVIVRACLWQHTRLSRLQALPNEGKPIESANNRDECLAAVAEGIRLAAVNLRAIRE